MSFYATLHGAVKCHDPKEFNRLIDRLEAGGWLKYGKFTAETGEFIRATPCVDYTNMEIEIPLGDHRNLTRVDFFAHPTTEGAIFGSSLDGVEICWVDGPPATSIPEMPLTLFAAEDEAPTGEPDSEQYCMDRRDWLDEAAASFHSLTLEHITKEAEAHFGVVSLVANNVDHLLMLRQMHTLHRLLEQASDQPTKDHLTGVINMLAEAKRTDPV